MAMTDLNSASVGELMQVPGIGKRRAENIVQFREDNGKFQNVRELKHVEGIGDYRQLQHHVYSAYVPPPGGRKTETYRKHHGSEIERARAMGRELDVCHIFAKANGGANDEDNYMLAGRHFNRAIQHNADELMCTLAGVEQTRKAIRASRLHDTTGEFPYTTSDAPRLVAEGRKTFRSYRQRYGEDLNYWDAGYEFEDLDSSKIEDPNYCDWVIQIWNFGGGFKADESTLPAQ